MLHRACVLLSLITIVAGGVLAAQPAHGQLFTEPANDHPNPYLTINDHFKLPAGRS